MNARHATAHRCKHPANNGGKWIRPRKRLAIYLRDGLACVWCGDGVEDTGSLTLDHLTPWSKGGTNNASNLVTACRKCNSARGNRGIRAFAKVVSDYMGVDMTNVLMHVRRCRRRSWQKHLTEADTIIARRNA